MNESPEKLPPLEQALLDAMQALDIQIAREMQRSPAERTEQGVQKWEPINKRVERVTAFVLNALGEQDAQLDSLLVLSQAMAKALRMATEDLGEQGLGKVRTGYCLGAFEAIEKDAYDGQRLLRPEPELS